jgi:eukaryotic-like serine/threonine-protein kinase
MKTQPHPSSLIPLPAMFPERWQQVAQVFEAALEVELAQRAAFLAEACAGEVELQREVETLLKARDRAGDFLQQDALVDEAVRTAAEKPILATGQRVAHFEVLAPLGAGAMGEVYRARDTRLERPVALKLLPPRFLADAGRVRRFAREARAASALNHPNIITVYDIGLEGTQPFIAAEYVAGQTLRERLSAGRLPWAAALAIGKQIAAALDAAHTAGIAHRDIKPENVMLREDGVVKVLDFGIAKLLVKEENRKQKDGVNGSITFQPSTEHGTVIGTPGYMSPEQARGLDVDARTDVFSLGVVFYEMLAGHAPFRGATNADVIVALLEREPEPLSEVEPSVPAGVDALVRRTLAKEAGQRYQSVAEWLADLESVAAGSPPLRTELRQPRALVRPTRLRQLAGVLLLLGVIAAGALAWRAYRTARSVNGWSDPTRIRVSTPYSTRMGLGGQLSPPSFAPDGQRIVFSLGAGGRSHIVVRDLSSGGEAKLTNAEYRDYDPLWSPDGQRIAYISIRGNRDQVRLLSFPQPPSAALSSTSASADTLLKEFDPAMPAPFLRAWQRTAQGERIYFEAGSNLYTLDPATNQVEQLTQLDPQRTRTFSLSPAPTGDRVVYLEQQDGQTRLMLQALNGAPELLWRRSTVHAALVTVRRRGRVLR